MKAEHVSGGANSEEITFMDGTTEMVDYAGSRVGKVGVTAGVGLKVFKWNQHRFRVMDGYGMSVGLFKKLEEMEVDLVHVETEDGDALLTLSEVRKSQRLSRFNEIFNEIPPEDQYVIKAD